MKKLLFILIIASLFDMVQAANRFGDTYHGVKIVDETGRVVEDITNLYIYLAGTTTDATIYMDAGRQNTITIPMTEASTNTTLVDGVVHWWGPDTYDFSMTNTDGVGPMTNSGHADRNSAGGTLVFPTYLVSITTTTYDDGETITMGTGADWVFQGGNVANQLSFTPIADDSTVNFGTSGTTLNTNFNVFTGTALGFKLSSSGATHSLTYDGGIVNLNPSSNFAVNLCTGTSTGATTIGNSAGGAVAVDTDSGITVNADDSYALTVSAGSISATADGASAGDITLDAEDTMNLISVDIKFFNGAAAETWEIEGTADAHEAQVVFTDPTADVVWTFPTAAADTFAVMASTLATNAPEIANSVSGGTNQLIFEGTADAHECILTATDATADTIYTLPDAAAATYGLMPSSLAANGVDIANSVTGGTNQFIFEGATADAHETILTPEDPTADTVYTIPDAAAGTYGLVTSSLAANGFDIVNAVWGGTNQFIFEGATADAFETILTPTDATADRTITIPDATGSVELGTAATTVITADTTATITVVPGTDVLYTYTIDTDNEDCTLTFSAGGTASDRCSIIFETDTGGGGDEVMTFDGTLAMTEGTLTLANATANRYVMSFVSDGTVWMETSRTAILP